MELMYKYNVDLTKKIIKYKTYVILDEEGKDIFSESSVHLLKLNNDYDLDDKSYLSIADVVYKRVSTDDVRKKGDYIFSNESGEKAIYEKVFLRMRTGILDYLLHNHKESGCFDGKFIL